jgi:fructoselysine-6-P-deglycase FrlB-like protein
LVQSKREDGKSPILSLDFDDTLHFNNGKTAIPNLFLINFAKKIIQENDTLQILTSRSGEQPDIVNFAKKYELKAQIITCGSN